MLLVITRSNVSFPVTYNLRLEMMKSTSLGLDLLVYRADSILCRLNRLLGDVVISQGGVVPHINPEVSRLQC